MGTLYLLKFLFRRGVNGVRGDGDKGGGGVVNKITMKNNRVCHIISNQTKITFPVLSQLDAIF